MEIKATTILCVKRGNQISLGGDGQATFGHTVLKKNVSKVKRLYHDKVITGMAGSTADAFTLYEKFEAKLNQYQGQLLRAAVELARGGAGRGDSERSRVLHDLPLDRQGVFLVPEGATADRRIH